MITQGLQKYAHLPYGSQKFIAMEVWLHGASRFTCMAHWNNSMMNRGGSMVYGGSSMMDRGSGMMNRGSIAGMGVAVITIPLELYDLIQKLRLKIEQYGYKFTTKAHVPKSLQRICISKSIFKAFPKFIIWVLS